MRAEKARVELEKELESEREEALWLSEVEARQMREMEAKCVEMQARLSNYESERALVKEKEAAFQKRICELEVANQTQMGVEKDSNIKQYMVQLVSNNEAMEREVLGLRAELTEAARPAANTAMARSNASMKPVSPERAGAAIDMHKLMYR